MCFPPGPLSAEGLSIICPVSSRRLFSAFTVASFARVKAMVVFIAAGLSAVNRMTMMLSGAEAKTTRLKVVPLMVKNVSARPEFRVSFR